MARQLIHSQDFEVCQMGTMEVSVSKMTFFLVFVGWQRRQDQAWYNDK